MKRVEVGKGVVGRLVVVGGMGVVDVVVGRSSAVEIIICDSQNLKLLSVQCNWTLSCFGISTECQGCADT